ncbi:MAG TPA: glycosyltransferase [Ruminiclostridium sp.]|nr:glycosyltransferase [Ruminiclostridium sp.]
MKKFSFVIPTYQNKELIKNTLESLNYQKGYSRQDYEVVLVDDGSTDGTGEYISGVNKNYDLKYVYLERNGDSCRGRARNRGWQEASGEIIIFIDGDILVKDDYLNELDRCMSVANNLLVVGNIIMLRKDVPYEMICDREAFNKKICCKPKYDQLDPRYFLFYEYSYNTYCQTYPWLNSYGANLAVRKKWLEKTGGFDEKFKSWGHEDIEFGYSLWQIGVKVVVSSKLTVLHQSHRTYSQFVARQKMLLEKSQNNLDYFLEKHPASFNESRDAVNKYFNGGHTVELAPKQKKLSNRITIEFKNKCDLEIVKGDIAALARKAGNRIKVYDHVEDTDLDIWIQLLGKCPSVPRYYPVSRVRYFRSILGPRIILFKMSLLYISISLKIRKIGSLK